MYLQRAQVGVKKASNPRQDNPIQSRVVLLMTGINVVVYSVVNYSLEAYKEIVF